MALTWLAAGCSGLEFGNMETPSEAMLSGIQSWRDKASPEDQAAIDKVASRKDVFFHVIPADLSGEPTRGAKAMPRSNKRSKKFCIFHPVVSGIHPDRNWDVFYDRKVAEEYERRTKIPPSFECSMQHEILGHVVPVLDDFELLDRLEHDEKLRDENERDAREIENRCRRRMKLREIPEAKPIRKGQ